MIDISAYTQLPASQIEYQLKQEEGCVPIMYKDTVGFNTCGIGHNCDASPLLPIIGRKLKPGEQLTPEEINRIFEHDLLLVLDQLHENVDFFPTLDMYTQYVLISMTWNLGIKGLLKFAIFLTAVKKGQTQKALAEMKNSKWAKQVPNRVKRLQHVLEFKNLLT